ncbi:hypothetical protein V1264_018405 [Littorina saxatilis]|uniref:F-box domain-containing protein n=1 Tax=Littorina saxatilis TaxID=31220 RepID=A0AAN9BEZ1_9CAEN
MEASHVPEEIWLKVFSYLEPPDLYNSSRVCHHWSLLIDKETLWKCQCLSVRDSQIKQQILSDKFKQQRCWKDAYRNNYGCRLIKRRWMEGHFSNVNTLKELPAKVFCSMDVNTWGEIFEHELNR